MTTGVSTALWQRVPSIGHHPCRHKEQHSPKAHLGHSWWRWKLATSFLLVLGVHSLTVHILVPLATQATWRGEGSSQQTPAEKPPLHAGQLPTPSVSLTQGAADVQSGHSVQQATSLQAVASHRGTLVIQPGHQKAQRLHSSGLVLSAAAADPIMSGRGELQTGGATAAAAAGGVDGRSMEGAGSVGFADPGSAGRRALIQQQQQQAGQGQQPVLASSPSRQGHVSSTARWRCEEGAWQRLRVNASSYWHDFALRSKSYINRFGHAAPPAKWCRGDMPWAVPQLRTVARLESSQPRSSRGITVATQLSLERLGMLGTLCRLWRQHISAAVYIPLLLGRVYSPDPALNGSTLDIAILRALRFHASVDEAQSCMLDLELVTEERCSSQAALQYPVNAVRNRALMNVKTEAVLLLDVDFGVSSSLSALQADSQQYMQLMWALQQGAALVLPALEAASQQGLQGRDVALKALALGKAFVAEQFSRGALRGFHSTSYPTGHGPTDVQRWMSADQAYNVSYELGFEPHLLMATSRVPWFDERFRGYHWNRAQHLLHMVRQLKYQLAVHPTAYLVHLPHMKQPHSRARQVGQQMLHKQQQQQQAGEEQQQQGGQQGSFLQSWRQQQQQQSTQRQLQLQQQGQPGPNAHAQQQQQQQQQQPPQQLQQHWHQQAHGQQLQGTGAPNTGPIQDKSLKELNRALLETALLEMGLGRYVPVTAFPQNCIGSTLLSTV